MTPKQYIDAIDRRGPEVMETHLYRLYRHFDADGGLLYIGISKDAEERLMQHCGEWKQFVFRSEIVAYPTRGIALAAEAEAIRLERPKFNVTHLPRENRREQHTMTNEQYRKSISKLGLTQGAAAEFLGISIRTSNGYANDRLIPEHISKLLRLMIKLNLKPDDL